ncbi:hypothetical protein TWF679_011393 [Orbilia oligospora]|uniref:Conidiation-specific protein 13 n=1 Tax=Orbilia oligospora TaxID=2813651 RepID=A0A8H8UXZ5_ORBOL|nr:hypothetical protein TWF679_011393 [Orbilia oligospora]
MINLFSNIVAVVAVSAVGVLADLKNKTAYPDGLSGPFTPGFNNYTEAPLEWFTPWGAGWIPKGCKDRFIGKGYDADDVEVFNIKYTDCDQAWTFCRHKDAQLSLEDMADSFGRMSVHMRSLVRHPIALPASSGCSALAYTDIGDIVMFGNCKGLTVWLHETGHQLDARLKPSNRFSGTTPWLEALERDTCVPDSYANTNTVEDFAQVVVVAQHETLLGYKPEEAFPGCLDQRQGLLEHTFQSDYLEYVGRCSNRPRDSEIVSTKTTKREKMKKMKRDKAQEGNDPNVVGPCSFP